MNQRLVEQILTIVSQAISRASAGARDVVVIGEPSIGALCEELTAAGAHVAIHASATDMSASLHPVVVIDARSASVDVRIADLLVSLTRLAPAGIYVATAPFAAGAEGGFQHLTLFDAIQAIAELVAGGNEAARGVTVLPRSDGPALELSTLPMEVRAFFERAVAAVEQRNGLVVVRRSEANVDQIDPIDIADLPVGPAFEARRLSHAIGPEGLADLALECFDRRIVAEIDILKRRLAQRDRDLAELRAAFKRTLTTGSPPPTPSGLRIIDVAIATARSAARSSDFRHRMRQFERSIRKVWKDPLTLVGTSKKKR
jgi:hypothetical protein